MVVGILRSLVELRQQEPGDDLVSALVVARDGDEQLTTEELLSTIFQLIVAGHETTTNLIGNSVVALFQHPEQLAALRADPTQAAGRHRGADALRRARSSTPPSATPPSPSRSATPPSRPAPR